jgi:hypothetical protein
MRTGARRALDEPDVVTNADSGNDVGWFAAAENAGRKFRGRLDATGRLWVIRHRADGIFLRTRTTATKMPRRDADPILSYLFFSNIWGDLTPREVRRLARRALKGSAR